MEEGADVRRELGRSAFPGAARVEGEDGQVEVEGKEVDLAGLKQGDCGGTLLREMGGISTKAIGYLEARLVTLLIPQSRGLRWRRPSGEKT